MKNKRGYHVRTIILFPKKQTRLKNALNRLRKRKVKNAYRKKRQCHYDISGHRSKL